MSDSMSLTSDSISFANQQRLQPVGVALNSLGASAWKRHFWYAGIVATLILLNSALLPAYAYINFYSTLPGPAQWVLTSLMGAFLGQFILLMIWMSFGCFRAPWRQLICTLFVLCGGFFLVYEIDPNGFPENMVTALAISLLLTSILWFGHTALLVLRQFTSITLEFHQLRPQSSRLPHTYSISSIMLLMLFLAIPCMLLNWGISIDPEMVTSAIAISVVVLVVLIALLPLALSILRPKYAVRSTLAASIVVCAVAGLFYLARATLGFELVLMYIAAAATVALNLFLLRIVGLRWLPNASASNASVDRLPACSPV